MDDLTHTLFAVTAAQTPLRRAGPGTTATMLLASIAPDIDIVSALQGGSVAYLAAHRGPTHGVIGILCLALATAALVRLCSARVSFWNMVVVAMIGAAFHVLMDLATSYGTRLLSPIDWTWYAFDWFPIVDIYLLALLVIGVLALLFRPAARARIVAVVLVLMAGHYALRAFAHELALRRTIPDIPGLSRACLGTGFVSWNSLRDENETSLCAERRAALPTFGSPFTWRLVRQFSSWYELSDFDLLTGRAGPATRFPNERTTGIFNPGLVRTAAVFLHFARFPAASITEAAGGTTTVRWDDMRFVGGFTRMDSGRPSPRRIFTATVELDRAGRVVAERLGGR